MKPLLLGNNPISFDTSGFGKLDGTVSAFVTEELNGDYSLTMEISFDDPNFQNIKIGSVIAVQPNKYDPRQGFVVEHIGKPIDGICEIYATHIAQYRGKLIPVSPFTASSLADALTAMISNSLETNPFTITTDKTSSVAMVQTVPHTFRELMGGTLGSLIDTYSGEFKYNNYNIQFLNRRGRTSTDIQVLYGKNMTGFDLNEDFSWTDSVTGVLPFWSMEGSSTVVGSVQYSPYKDLYPYAKTGVLDCTQQFSEQPTAEQLNEYAATYISNKGIPAVNMEVTFDHLQFSGDMNMQIGDTVTVINSMYNVNYKRRIVGYVFNVLLEEYETVTIGDLKASISDAVSEVFDNSVSGLKILAENVNYSKANSGLSATNAQNAIDELASEKANILNQAIKNPTLRWGIQSNTDNDSVPRVELRRSGNVGSYGLSTVYYDSSNATHFSNIYNSSGVFLPDYVKVRGIQIVSVSYASSVADKGSATLTGTMSNVSGASTYYTIPLWVNFGFFTAAPTKNGTTLSVTAMNASGASHTLTGSVLVIAAE